MAIALAASTRPAPTLCGPWIGIEPAGEKLLTSNPAVFMTAALSSETVQEGRFFRSRAMTPAR